MIGGIAVERKVHRSSSDRIDERREGFLHFGWIGFGVPVVLAEHGDQRSRWAGSGRDVATPRQLLKSRIELGSGRNPPEPRTNLIASKASIRRCDECGGPKMLGQFAGCGVDAVVAGWTLKAHDQISPSRKVMAVLGIAFGPRKILRHQVVAIGLDGEPVHRGQHRGDRNESADQQRPDRVSGHQRAPGAEKTVSQGVRHGREG